MYLYVCTNLRGARAPASPPCLRHWSQFPCGCACVVCLGQFYDSLVMVFIQGCAGAYSEAAAKKAYPNCEAVPCEHFDTAFQVAKGIAC
jgi:arogenate/prephenate dehydratase